MQWDYGQQSRGSSGEKLWFYEPLCSLAEKVDCFWYDQYLLQGNYSQLQIDLCNYAKSCQPDLIIFVPYKDQFSFETLDYLKTNYKTYAWFGDDQWRFDLYTKFYAPHFTYVSTTDLWSVYKYEKLGIQPIVSQWAARTYGSEVGPLSRNETYDYEISFVGGYSTYREWFISQLKQQGFSVECFGAGWTTDRVTFQDMEFIFRKSKINLNISNSANNDIRFVLSDNSIFEEWKQAPKKAEQIKARNFEIPLAGGFQLSNYVLGLERFWEIGTEIAVYTTPEECIQQIRYFLDNETERHNITLKSHKRALNEHTYSNRLDAILGAILS